MGLTDKDNILFCLYADDREKKWRIQVGGFCMDSLSLHCFSVVMRLVFLYADGRERKWHI